MKGGSKSGTISLWSAGKSKVAAWKTPASVALIFLAAIVGLDRGWYAAMRGYTIERGDHGFAVDALAQVTGHALARVVIDQGQRPQPSTIEQFLGHKSHAPDFTDRRGQLLR